VRFPPPIPRRTVALVALALIGLAAHASDGDAERSVQPGANAKYLDPNLDVTHWQEIFEGESREIYRSRGAIVAALGLAPGMRVADVGAGTGLFLEPFAAAVGDDGRVVAVDISPVFVEHLKRRAAKAGLEQVDVVQGDAHTTGLPEGSLDLVFLCDVYHHLEYPRATLASLHRALRPGGQLVVIDFERIPGESRDWIVEHVRADKQAFSDEITDAGFALEGELAVAGLSENYMLRFRRP
jgi:SAM-dependent methyltransferase